MGRPSPLLGALVPDLRCTALILAGGLSTRMGQDKALLSYAGQTLLGQTCTAALACTHDVHVFTPWPDRYRAHVPAGVTLHFEPRAAGTAPGPLVALSQALGCLTSADGWLLLLACDWWGLSGSVLVQGRQQLSSLSVETVAYLPRSAKGWEPLHGFYRLSHLRQRLPAIIAQGTSAFQPWLARETVTEWLLAKPVPMNCNTLADWQRAQHRMETR
ncbi:MAG: molybdenum cofactor guanylyltransferase [Cyanobacteria bacterium J06628_6]